MTQLVTGTHTHRTVGGLPHNDQSKWFQDRFQALGRKLNLKAAFHVHFKEGVKSLSEVYLDSFPAPEHRQYYNCKTCLHVIDTIGCAVYVNEHTGELIPALWDITDLDELAGDNADMRYWTPVITALHDHIVQHGVIYESLYPILQDTFVKSTNSSLFGAPIRGRRKDGVADNWDHISAVYHCTAQRDVQTGAVEAVELVKRNIHGYKDQELKIALTLLENDDQLKTRTKQITDFKLYLAAREHIANTKNRRLRENLYWVATIGAGVVIAHFGNTVCGQFVSLIAEGQQALAISRFLGQTRPENYMRATEAPSEGNVAEAKRIVADLGLEQALVRRRQYRVDDILEWIKRIPAVEEIASAGSIFDGLATKATNTKPKLEKPSFTKTMLPETFVSDILLKLNVISVDVLVTGRAAPFHGFTTAIDPNDGIIYRWDTPERRNTVAGFTYTNPTLPGVFGLTSGWKRLHGVTRTQTHWFTDDAKSTTYFAVVPATEYKPTPLCLFADTLIPALFPVRSTMEALMNSTNGESVPDGVAAIPLLAGVSLCVETDIATFNVTIGSVR